MLVLIGYQANLTAGEGGEGKGGGRRGEEGRGGERKAKKGK